MKCFHYLCLVKADHNIAYSLGNGIRTNGFESFWAILKRGVYCVHNVSVKHMLKYVNEFCPILTIGIITRHSPHL